MSDRIIMAAFGATIANKLPLLQLCWCCQDLVNCIHNKSGQAQDLNSEHTTRTVARGPPSFLNGTHTVGTENTGKIGF